MDLQMQHKLLLSAILSTPPSQLASQHTSQQPGADMAARVDHALALSMQCKMAAMQLQVGSAQEVAAGISQLCGALLNQDALLGELKQVVALPGAAGARGVHDVHADLVAIQAEVVERTASLVTLVAGQAMGV